MRPNLFLIFFYFISNMVFSRPVDSVEIKIKAPFYKGCKVNLICSSFLVNSQQISLKLDRLGEGQTKIPVDEKTFWTLTIGENYESCILLDKNYNLSVYFENDNKLVFSGNGATVNSYLTENFLLGQKLDTQADKIDRTVKNINSFLKLVNLYQEKFNTLYKKYYSSINPDKKLDYILTAINQCYILNQKQKFLNSFQINVVNELKLEERLGLDKNNLLNDTILIKMKNFYSLGNFGNYLTSYRYYYLLKTFGSYDPDQETINQVFLRDFKSIENNPFYSIPVKKEQLFREFYINFLTSPFSSVLDSVFLSMKNTYMYDPCLEVIDSLRKQNMHLKKGNLAPPLQGIDLGGKIVSLTDFKGKVIFIDNWATWCGGCIKSLPHIFEIQKHFEGNTDVKFIYLSHDSDKEKWLSYLNNHPQFQGVHLLLQDDKFEKAWDGLGTPQYIIINKDGEIVNAFAEPITATKEIQEALNRGYK